MPVYQMSFNLVNLLLLILLTSCLLYFDVLEFRVIFTMDIN